MPTIAPKVRRPYGEAVALLRSAHAARVIDWRLPDRLLSAAWGCSLAACTQMRAEAGAGPAWWSGVWGSRVPADGWKANAAQIVAAARWRAGR